MIELRIKASVEIEAAPGGYVVISTIEQDGVVVSESQEVYPNLKRALVARGIILAAFAKSSLRDAEKQA